MGMDIVHVQVKVSAWTAMQLSNAIKPFGLLLVGFEQFPGALVGICLSGIQLDLFE